MSHLEVITPGLASTIQDRGRHNVLALGLSEGGAIDPFAHWLGQRLLNNDRSAAAVEVPWGDFAIKAHTACAVAITGADCSPKINGLALPMNEVCQLSPMDHLTMDRPHEGVYSYLSVAGGIATTPAFGSRSTVVREGLGGLAGRTLRRGDLLPITRTAQTDSLTAWPIRKAKPELLTLRFVPGFHFAQFPAETQALFQSTRFRVSHQANRMGIHLEGPLIKTDIEQLWSEATCLGAIQIPPSGHPIILLNDRQTLGGYPKAGAVISVDCARLAQARPNTEVVFQACSAEQADRILWLEGNFRRELVPIDLPSRDASSEHD